jgi:hypothetical protein
VKSSKRLFKKDIREGEEKLLLAVLGDAIEHFQKYALSKDEKGGSYSKRRKSGFWRKTATSFSPLNTSVRFCSCAPITYVKGYYLGRQGNTLLKYTVRVARS